jgi:hypothetical protein
MTKLIFKVSHKNRKRIESLLKGKQFLFTIFEHNADVRFLVVNPDSKSVRKLLPYFEDKGRFCDDDGAYWDLYQDGTWSRVA